MKEEFEEWLKNFVLEPDAIEDDDLIISLFKTVKNYELLEYVILSGDYDLNYADKTGVTPLHVVCGGDFSDILASRIVELLANEGTKLDVVDSFGRTPLILAIETEKLATAEELIHQGVSVDKVGGLISPLILSVKMGADNTAVSLIRAGANVNEISDGRTPLSIAKDNRSNYLQGFLEGRGAVEMSPDSSDEDTDPRRVDDEWFE